jgi:crotonobetainyl-CoA:carnitine CoA-transferase CaiB-like acyl-CoA transferase
MLAVVPDDDLGTVTMAAPVPRLSATPGRIHKSGGRVGQDTRRILNELAGLPVQEIDRLAADGVICCEQMTVSEAMQSSPQIGAA